MSGPNDTTRFHALDSLRATAMLLGVVYHSLIFRMFLGGGPPGPMGMGRGGADRYLQDWLHSFRMPLFFLISGFFCRMMFFKYGPGEYLRKRWWRIGIPLLLGIFTFGPAYVLTRDALSSGPGIGGGPPPMVPSGPPGPGFSPPGALAGDADDLPPPPPGFVPPPLVRFDEDQDGSLNDAEWKKAKVELQAMFGGGGPMPGPMGPPGAGPMPPAFGPPGFGPMGGGFPALSERIFGTNARLFQLNHLWFLWYLLLFVTVAPLVAAIFARIGSQTRDRFSSKLIRSGFAPIVLGLISTPALMITSGPFGWSLGMPASIFRAFPDFLLHFDREMVFYFLFFMTGWWLHRERALLPSLSRTWLPDLVVGLVSFGAATWLSDTYGQQRGMPSYALIRASGYALYCLGSAATSFGLIGFFQRYLEHPSRLGRYLADTALWVYLVHQPLVILGLALFTPLHLPWWALTASVSILAVAIALFLYEAIVRPTFLVRLFGPAPSRKTTTEA